MSKRLKILLIVFGALLVLGGGTAAIFIMTAESPETAEPVKVAKKAPGKKPAGKKAAPKAKKPAKPGQEEAQEDAGMEAPGQKAVEAPEETKGAPANKTGEESPAEATEKPAAVPKRPVAKKEADTAAGKPEGEPGKVEAAKEKGAKAPPPRKPSAKEAAGEAVAAAKKPSGKEGVAAKKPESSCNQVIVVAKDRKKTEFKTAEEFLEKSGMKPEEMTGFSDKFLGDKKKTLDALKKKKGASKDDIACAEEGVKLAESLKDLVTKKYPPKPKKEVYTYLDLGKRDPFMNPFEIPKKEFIVPDSAPPVQHQPAETLKIKGIMWTDRGYRALMLTQDGRGYTVKVGDKVGNKGGEITEITKTKVIVTEKILDIFDNTEVRVTEISLHN